MKRRKKIQYLWQADISSHSRHASPSHDTGNTHSTNAHLSDLLVAWHSYGTQMFIHQTCNIHCTIMLMAQEDFIYLHSCIRLSEFIHTTFKAHLTTAQTFLWHKKIPNHTAQHAHMTLTGYIHKCIFSKPSTVHSPDTHAAKQAAFLLLIC